MHEQINKAPYGSLSLTEDHTILTVNETLLHLLGYDLAGLRGCEFETILTRSSCIFYKIYFFSLIKLNGKIEEMHLSLRSIDGVEFPVVLNAVRREYEGKFIHDCVIYPQQSQSSS